MLHFNFKMTNKQVEQEVAGSRVALGVTGGIAAYKAIEVLRGLQRLGCEVRVTMTKHACEFIQPLTFRALSGSYVLVDDYAADNPDPIAHITFSQTIDLFIIVPATANTLAKLANGIADDFLSSTYLACTAPVLVAPAMNTVMWEHPATRRNLQKLRDDGVILIDPDEGEMACGAFGPGRLSEPERIVSAALDLLREHRQGNLSGNEARSSRQTSAHSEDLSGERFLITAGATREPIDPVRFISNRSSGRMGFALAQAARERGAEVTIIAGITSVEPPRDVRVVRVNTAEEMRVAVAREAAGASVFMGAAAVSDYRAREKASTKIKKSESEIELKLERTTDILGEVARGRTKGQLVIGFAAETNDLLTNAHAKLVEKDLDAIVANDVSGESSGFDSENNAVVILLRDHQQPIELPLMSKLEIAHRILDEVVQLRRKFPVNKAASIQSA
ncbi:MAG: phosphopantothenoylcysteine decarboxylase / phosphopantothenate---cysteine ligase [Blastocatellia bacterium]|jgi:phosphopantothenoylcysteine decarboxylase/phosphopantothenate--cysteine ligase|nr:phosphopantothenoylcysteine decarboxylase / phosphopantothenate---cysteine ligase [Blastocatellia bacterium]